MDTKDEKGFIERIRKKAKGVFKELYENYKDKVYRTCFRILGNTHDAEDAAQDTFINIHENLLKFRAESSLSTWIYQITVNTSLRKLAKRKRVQPLPPMESIVTEKTQDPKEIEETLQKALDQLPPKLKACVVLRIIEERSYDEISKILKIPIGTVMSRLNSARTNIKEFLKANRIN